MENRFKIGWWTGVPPLMEKPIFTLILGLILLLHPCLCRRSWQFLCKPYVNTKEVGVNPGFKRRVLIISWGEAPTNSDTMTIYIYIYQNGTSLLLNWGIHETYVLQRLHCIPVTSRFPRRANPGIMGIGFGESFRPNRLVKNKYYNIFRVVKTYKTYICYIGWWGFSLT